VDEWGKQGKPISEGQVAKLLKGFKVKPRTIRAGERTSKGYLQEQFNDVFVRYLPPQAPASPHQGVTPSQVSDINDLRDIANVTNDENVTARSPSNPLQNNNCDGVTASQGENGDVRVCDQCHGPPDGTELLHGCTDGRQVWLHCQCRRFYADASDADVNAYNIHRSPEDRRPPAISSGLDDDLGDFV